MLRKSSMWVMAVVLATVWLAGCAGQATTPVSHGDSVVDTVGLLEELRVAGAAVELAGEISQPFFSVEGQIVKVNGGDVQVFEYVNEAATQIEAALVSPDGSSIGTTMVSWVAAPHFYQAGGLIVLYVGDEADVIDVLEGALGAQFAGRGQS